MSEELMITKILDVEVKEVSDRVLEFVGSTEDVDREGETISAEGWDLKNYKKNPVFLWAHDYRSPPIGKSLRVKAEDGKLMFKIEFADAETYAFADTIYRLYKGGFLKATSVGFIPKEWNDGDGDKAPRRAYIKQELLELSAVPVPANPNALQTAQEEGVITVKEFEALMPVPDGGIILPPETVILHSGEPVIPLDMLEKPFPNEHSCRLKNPDDFKEGSFRRTSRTSDGKKYSVIMGRLKGETTMTEQAYRYDKEIWQAGEARTHCKEHEGSFEAASPKEVSQGEILDELDYLIKLIDTEGMNEEVRGDAWKLVRELLRLLGSDIPIDIKEMIAPQVVETKVTFEAPLEISDERVMKIVAEQVARAIRKEKGAID